MIVTASVGSSEYYKRRFWDDGDPPMAPSLASPLDGWSAVPGLLSTALTEWATSLPDPIQLRLEGVALQSQETAPDPAIAYWCKRAHECLNFLAATDPARIWIWQEQVFPLLLALSASAGARRAGPPGEAQPIAPDTPVQRRQRRRAAACSRKTGAG
jgi:hypothetical protein